MTVQDEYRRALREIVGPAVRGHGFRGSGSSWRRWNAAGDCAVINVQSSKWNTSESMQSVVNIGVLSEPFRQRLERRLGKRVDSKNVHVYQAHWQSRLHPSGAPAHGPEQWWRIRNAEDAAIAANDVVAQLEAVGFVVLEQALAALDLGAIDDSDQRYLLDYLQTQDRDSLRQMTEMIEFQQTVDSGPAD